MISERAPATTADAWQPLSTRLDETGHLVTRLVGMTLTQFCQVAMLPQGRFQAFLRARSEERHALLQQVFQTGRFDSIERWLRDRRVAAAAHAPSTHQRRRRRPGQPGQRGGRRRRARRLGRPTPTACAAWIGELTTSAVTASVEQTIRGGRRLRGRGRPPPRPPRPASSSPGAAPRTPPRVAPGPPSRRPRPTHDDRVQPVAQAQRAAGVRPLHELAVERAGARCASSTSRAAAAREPLADAARR